MLLAPVTVTVPGKPKIALISSLTFWLVIGDASPSAVAKPSGPDWRSPILMPERVAGVRGVEVRERDRLDLVAALERVRDPGRRVVLAPDDRGGLVPVQAQPVRVVVRVVAGEGHGLDLARAVQRGE